MLSRDRECDQHIEYRLETCQARAGCRSSMYSIQGIKDPCQHTQKGEVILKGLRMRGKDMSRPCAVDVDGTGIWMLCREQVIQRHRGQIGL